MLGCRPPRGQLTGCADAEAASLKGKERPTTKAPDPATPLQTTLTQFQTLHCLLEPNGARRRRIDLATATEPISFTFQGGVAPGTAVFNRHKGQNPYLVNSFTALSGLVWYYSLGTAQVPRC